MTICRTGAKKMNAMTEVEQRFWQEMEKVQPVFDSLGLKLSKRTDSDEVTPPDGHISGFGDQKAIFGDQRTISMTYFQAAAGVFVEIILSTKGWGIKTKIEKLETEDSFTLDDYLTYHNRQNEKETLFYKTRDHGIGYYLNHLTKLLEGEMRDIIQGKRWEFVPREDTGYGVN